MRHGLAVAVAIATGYLGAGGVANAFESRSNASVCLGPANWAYSVSDGLVNQSGATGTVICPFVDDTSSFLVWTGSTYVRNINALNIHGSKSGTSGTVWASACVKFYGSSGFSCGTSSSATASGAFTLQPGRSVWQNNYTHFAYVTIDLTANSSVYGWWIST